MVTAVPGRNDPCPCGSGRKFKACCGRLPDRQRAGEPDEPSEDQTALVDELGELALLIDAGHYLELEQRARRLLSAQPALGAAWQLLGIALRAQSKDPLPALERAAQLLPHDPVAQLNLGNAYGRVGRLREAAISFNRALELRQQFPEAYANLAAVQIELGQFHQAESSCREALKIRPDYTDALRNAAVAQMHLGRNEEAHLNCTRALQLEPDSAATLNALGNVLRHMARLDEAMVCFRRALHLQPDFAEAHVNLANALRSVGQLDAAAASYRRALECRPDFVAAHAELATTLRLQRRTAECEASCARALALDPRHVPALVALAELRADLGHFSAAEEIFRRAIAIDPQAVEPCAGIARLRRLTRADSDWLASACRLIESGGSASRQLQLHFAVAKYFDDTGQYDQAFAHFRRANELSRQCGSVHDRDAMTRAVDRLMRTSSVDMRLSAIAMPDSSRPVFVVGMLRSGTTLAEQILAAHPAVYGAGELSFWSSQAGILTAEAEADTATLATLAHDYLQLLAGLSAGALRVVDKMPTNFFFLGLIHAALPNARIIHMQRNPIDTCLSIYFQQFEAANTYTNDLHDLAHYYREYRRIMQHWRSTLPPGALLEVPYEGLVADPETWSRRMIGFIGLPWDPHCLEFYKAERAVVTASKWQVRQKINNTSVNRWQHYADHVEPLRSLLE